MSIDRRGDTWRVRVQREGQRVSATFDREADAKAFEAAWIAAVGRGDPPPLPPVRSLGEPRRDDSHRVIDVAGRVGADMRSGAVLDKRGQRYKPSTLRKYEMVLRLYVLPHIGLYDVRDLTRADVQRMVNEIAAASSAESARKALVALRVILRDPLERREDMTVNPCVGVRVPSDGEHREVRIITHSERHALIAAATEDDHLLKRSLGGPLLVLLFGSGLRLGEALALPWGRDGLDLDGSVVHVRRSLDRMRDTTGEFPFVRPKTSAGFRSVPTLSDEDLEILHRHREESGDPPDGELVFSEKDGTPLNANGRPRHLWNRAIAAAEVADPRPRIHDIRHAWAVDMLRAGLRPEVVAKLGGWANARIVYERYGKHVHEDEFAAVRETLAAARQARSA